jgi:hypothetical protein
LLSVPELSEADAYCPGGFAHVYLVRLAQAANGSEVAVLKRVAVPDKEALANMRTEVVTMVCLNTILFLRFVTFLKLGYFV